MSTDVSVQDSSVFDQAIAEVRGGSTNWALFGHWDNNPNVLYHISSGTGGAEDLAQQVDKAQYQYAIVRVEETIDVSTTVKFAYITWQGPDFPFTKRGKFGVVHGSINKLFSPYHVSLEYENAEDITTANIMTKIAEASGTKNKVLEASEGKLRPERGFTSNTGNKSGPSGGSTPNKGGAVSAVGKLGSSFTGVAKGGAGVKFGDNVEETVKDVRSDTTETNWCVLGYEDGNVKNPIVILGVGSGGVDEFKELFKEDQIVYVLFRVTDMVDEIATVKFVYIQWVGEGVKPMSKAKISTHKGDIEKIFYPTHVNIFATTANEVSSRAIMDKVMSASGSKSNVK